MRLIWVLSSPPTGASLRKFGRKLGRKLGRKYGISPPTGASLRKFGRKFGRKSGIYVGGRKSAQVWRKFRRKFALSVHDTISLTKLTPA